MRYRDVLIFTAEIRDTSKSLYFFQYSNMNYKPKNNSAWLKMTGRGRMGILYI